MLSLRFHDLKGEGGGVVDSLGRLGATSEVMATWREIVPEDEDGEF